MGMSLVSQRFCSVCGTDHRGGECPGELRATGAERPGRRLDIETPSGREAVGVLLAPSYGQWRARILTFPNVLWTAPGGRGTLKFVGETREEAEALAISFVEEHVRSLKVVRSAGRTAPASRPGFTAVPRKLRSLPVRFGLERAVTRGMTVNLSAEGMFVGAPAPESEGRTLFINLDLEGHTLRMRGLVMWNRERAELHRPAGMGIRLSAPPPVYQSFVAALS